MKFRRGSKSGSFFFREQKVQYFIVDLGIKIIKFRDDLSIMKFFPSIENKSC